MTESDGSIADEPAGKPGRMKRWRKGIIAASVCLLTVGFFVWLWCYLQPDKWHYYTDETAFSQLAKDVKPRLVVWEAAAPSEGAVNIPADMSAPAISPDGTRMVFTKGLSEENADLYVSSWDGLAWGEPEPLRALNSKFNEIGPAFSSDGKTLYFSTDRPGGRGGFDIWVSRWDGAEFAWPMPLTLMVNSAFDDLGPAPSATGDKLYFSSNRPKRPLSEEESTLSGKQLRERFKGRDHDLFEASRIPAGVTNREVERATSMLYSLREAALSETNVMTKLGGSAESEAAIDKALEWLAANQETNGVWSIEKSGGRKGHDVAATAFALLTFAGRSELHDRPGKYRDTFSRGLAWLLEQQNTLTGDLRGRTPGSQAMYDHSIATLALAEIYGLTKDEDLYGRAQDAVDFLVDAQNEEDGGWRYTPNTPGDMSVSGWVIMALKSAEMTGLHVPRRTFDGVTGWLGRVSGGKEGGLYGYQGKGRGSAAMIATGYFCSQLMGLSPNTLRSFETAAYVRGAPVKVEDVYYAYYGTLCAYQNQGPLWREWQKGLHKVLLAAQQEDGSWISSGNHGDAMGRVIVTSLIALSLQAHYRYTPLYGLGYEPATNLTRISTASLSDLPEVPLYRRAKRIRALSSPREDVQPAVTEHGDFLYFASDREDGEGGLDIYRSRISGDEPLPPTNLGVAINSKADETGPALRMAGFNLLFTSDRGEKGKQHRWYHSVSRRVFRRHDYSERPAIGWMVEMFRWRLLFILLALALFVYFVMRKPAKHARKDADKAALEEQRRLVRMLKAWRRWLPVLVCVVSILALALSIILTLRKTIWCYYTDDLSIRRDAAEANVRLVLWEDPYPTVAPFNMPTNVMAPEFLADGASMTFVRDLPETTNAHLFLSRWDGRGWSDPEVYEPPTNADEVVTLPGRNGSYVYSESDAEGGLGGFDIYRGRLLNGEKLEPENLGAEINTPTDERAPVVRWEGFDLLFSSDRGQEIPGRYQLHTSTVREVVGRLDLSRWYLLRQLFNRIKWWILALLAAIALLLYLLRHWRDLTSLFHKCLVASLVIHLLLLLIMSVWFISTEIFESMQPKSMEVAIDVDALAQEKLALDMQDDVAELPATDVSVLIERPQEAVPMPEFTPPKRAKDSPIVTRSSDASFVTKVTPSKASEQVTEPALELTMAQMPQVDMPLLQMPELDVKLEEPAPSEPKETETAEPEDTTVSFEPADVQQEVKVELAKPQDAKTQPVDRIVEDTEELTTNLAAVVSAALKLGESLVAASTVEGVRREHALSGQGDASDLLARVQGRGEALNVRARGTLETPDKYVKAGHGEGKVAIGPGDVQGRFSVGFHKQGKVGTGAAGKAAGVSDVGVSGHGGAETRDTGGAMVVPSAGMESKGALPRMRGTGDMAALLIKSPLRGRELKMNAPGKLDVAGSFGKGISSSLLKNPGRLSTEVIEGLGGSAETQGSIARALEWFSKHQEPEGHWDIKKHGGQAGHDVAATSLILLCYYGWGAKHTEAGPHQDAVKRALDWLIGRMKKDKNGKLTGDYCSGSGNNGMYDQGMATIALCEAYGLTQDETLLEPAEKAVAFVVAAQHKQTGGWRYQPRSGSDTSVFGWQYMALKSADLAGLEVPEETMANADRWLDKVAGGKHGGLYGYAGPGGNQGAMIATGMFSRQLAGVPPTDPRMREGALYMKVHPISAKAVDFYYLYYGSLALYQHQGEIWEDWNDRMKETLTSIQHKTGDDAGSWDPQGTHGGAMGRAVATALGALSLEVYYRILPIYGFADRREE